MGVPMGRLVALQFREAAFYTDDGRAGSIDVMRVHLRCPDGDVHEHDLPNGAYNIENAALQFMAKWGYQPTDWPDDSAYLDTEDDQVLVPVAPMGDGFGLAQTAMRDAREALEDAEWFDSDQSEDDDSGPSDGPGGAPGPDPGTGNRGAVDDAEQGGVSAEMAGEESDQGVTVAVE
jgi:hypothetical protein